jgi:hypothetical protein
VSRRYADQIVVNVKDTADGIYPREFRWRGGRYQVQSVLGRWIEAAPWWRESEYHQPVQGREVEQGGGKGQGKVDERQVWRVEAAGPTSRLGVYDLCNTASGHWSIGEPEQEQNWFLVRALD